MSSNTPSQTLHSGSTPPRPPAAQSSSTETQHNLSRRIVADIFDPKPEAGQLWFKPIESAFYMVKDKDTCEEYEAIKAQVEGIRGDPSLPNRIDLGMDFRRLSHRTTQITQTRSQEPPTASAGRPPLAELHTTAVVPVTGRQRQISMQGQLDRQLQSSTQSQFDQENLGPGW